MQNAKVAYVGKDVQVKADAVENGDGGKVIVWSDDTTRYFGAISARGGEQGGDGGLVEVSGKQTLDFDGRVTTQAPAGKIGMLLLDPADVTISNAAQSTSMTSGALFSDGTASISNVNVATLVGALGSTSVVVDASAGSGSGTGTITVADPVTWGSASSLTLKATTDVTVNASITNTGSASLNLYGNGAIVVNNPVSVGGNFSVAGTSGGITQATSFSGNAQINGSGFAVQAGQIDLTSAGSLIAAGNTNLTAANININGILKHAPATSSSGVATLNATGNIALQGTIEGVGPGGYKVQLQGGTITTDATKTLNIIGSGENTLIEVDNGATWTNNGTVNMTGNSQIRLFDGSVTSTFTNSSGGQFNSSSTANWSFFSNPGSQNGIINNNGAMTIDGTAAGLQSFEAIFNQGATGTLTLANGATLSLQNAQSVEGAINLPLGNNIHVSEYHGAPATFTGVAFTGSGQLALTSSSVQATFDNVSAPDTPLSVSGAATTISGGTSVFASASGLGSNLTLDNGILAIKGGNFTVPAGASYSGNVGYYATGNLTVPAGGDISTFGSVTLIGGWNGNTGTPGVSGSGNININSAKVSALGGDATLSMSGSLSLQATTANAFIEAPDVFLTAGGNVSFSNSGTNKAYVTSLLAATTHLTFTNATGKVLFNGVGATATTSGNLGFFHGGAPSSPGIPSVLGTSLILSGGDPANFVASTPSVTPAEPPPPTVAECTVNPGLSGCSSVLPTLATCTTAPTTAGCSVVLPTLDTCVTNPTQAGCTAVLPTLSTCTTAPTTPGCGAVLPTVDACIANPTLPGCTAVIPSLSTCMANPSQPGCSIVLPSLSTCTASPTTAGCTAVLPTLSSCTTNPTQAGCSVVLPALGACVTSPTTPGCTAVLPTLSSCTTNPSQPGCTAVLPTLSSCTNSPTLPGCTAVLPTMSTCTAAPTTAGCTAVLPTLAQCSATPTLAGCSVVVPTANKCVLNPSAPECVVVLPVTDTGSTSSPVNLITETVVETSNLVLTTTAMMSSNQLQPDSGSSSGGGSGSEGKKIDKKTLSSTDDSGAKKNEPVRKMYCN
ncbi:hypothetical protein [Noviherbaspirillum denitrificans]|uniref:Uncharacterized protein n=1 Tax=Noviherbaspirillum denitrificans TaxID=1968433 RepID=A0A254TDS1_9BURK|nr:hypothetical protein [Noviherbaspirillum denitrificans]OWW20800.1 hypothetical protein AYR66_16305 [Noviherbaspirillum denitrificans]